MNNSAPVQLQQWADAPYPLIETPKHKQRKTGYTNQYMETASTMCVVHNSLLRGLNSIFIQGPNIQPTEYKDFIGYCLCWHSVIHEHHTSEEEQFFPEIEEAVGEKDLLDINVEQHSVIIKRIPLVIHPNAVMLKIFANCTSLDEFSNYLKGLAGREASFDATRLNGIITSFAPALCNHLTSEIQSLQDLSKYGDNLPLKDLWDREGKKTVTTMTKFSALPFFFLNLDVTHEDSLWKDWPPVPSPARWVITHCFTLWHPGYWKFASCDQSGKPKPLYAQVQRG